MIEDRRRESLLSCAKCLLSAAEIRKEMSPTVRRAPRGKREAPRIGVLRGASSERLWLGIGALSNCKLKRRDRKVKPAELWGSIRLDATELWC